MSKLIISSDFYSVPGTYQAMVQPRQAGMVDYGADIRYNFPAQKLLGASYGSLNYASMMGDQNTGRGAGCTHSSEGYCGSCNGAASVTENYGNSLSQRLPSSSLPVQGMANALSVNALGDMSNNPVVYDRYMFANQKSRLAAMGDPIRGDIVPTSTIPSGWFTPSVQPQIDLQSGAAMVMNGVDNSTSKQLLALKTAASAGALDTGSGINYAVQKSAFAGNQQGDIIWTAFP